MNLFYRNVYIINKNLVPKEGSVILIANHNNMAFDGAIIMATSDRPVRFLVAANL